jgi:hypothetical protein
VLALGLRQRAASGLFAGELVERGVQPARPKGLPGLDLLAAVPPLGVRVREDILRRGLRRRLVLVLLKLIFEL